MAAKAVCIVTRSEEGRGAYAVRMDNDENVYFPLSVTEALELEEFDEVEAILVKNDRPDPPWRAIRARLPLNGEDD
ncbi:MAG: hypothetical protein ACK4UL_01680 [Novosphingobium meiothermophilum]|uniref:hypothetical protein n=1 Tax=Novosphingobium TaxID=165696 RepID=UPI000D6DC5E7|nr:MULTISPECIES: hypothetical protein [Novosphingobium]